MFNDPEKKVTENIVGKGENAGNQFFSPFFHCVFYRIIYRNHNLNLICLISRLQITVKNLVQSKISFDKELNM